MGLNGHRIMLLCVYDRTDYRDEGFRIPKNTSVVVRRVPAARGRNIKASKYISFVGICCDRLSCCEERPRGCVPCFNKDIGNHRVDRVCADYYKATCDSSLVLTLHKLVFLLICVFCVGAIVLLWSFLQHQFGCRTFLESG
jgi:hypothetical protein